MKVYKKLIFGADLIIHEDGNYFILGGRKSEGWCSYNFRAKDLRELAEWLYEIAANSDATKFIDQELGVPTP